MAERRKVGREARARETCVLGREDAGSSSDSGSVVVVGGGGVPAKRLRGTAQAMGSPASRLKMAYSRRVQRPPMELRRARMAGERTSPPAPPPARICAGWVRKKVFGDDFG
jgi:hypothetical protein